VSDGIKLLLTIAALGVLGWAAWDYFSSSPNSDVGGDTGDGNLSTEDNTASSDVGATAAPGAAADSITQWADAIFHFEGGLPTSRNVRNNNPGNLKFAGQPGAIGKDDQGFAKFDSMASGWAALTRQLNRYVQEYPTFSLTQMMSRYLGQSGLNPVVNSQGNPFTYAKNIAGRLGVSPDDQLQNIFGG